MAGFTQLSGTIDPEEVADIANFCFNRLDSIITNNGGAIDKHEGDLVMALFGVPETHEDDPERAVKASLEMMQVIPKINETLSH